MSAAELLERVKTLPPRERRRFFEGVYELEGAICPQPPRSKRKIHWPDAAAWRRRIFGNKVALEQERY